MRTLVVFSVIFAVAFAAPTGEVENIEPVQSGHAEKRSIGHAVAIVDPATVYLAPSTTYYAGPSAVSHQSRHDVHTSQTVSSGTPVIAARTVQAYPSPAVVSGTPVVAARTVQAYPSPAVVSPLHTVYQAPSVYTVPAESIYTGGAVSHQSRVDSKVSSLVALEPEVVVNSAAVQSVPTVVENLPSVVDARSVYVVPASQSLYQPIVYSTLW